MSGIVYRFTVVSGRFFIKQMYYFMECMDIPMNISAIPTWRGFYAACDREVSQRMLIKWGMAHMCGDTYGKLKI
jgi:hypothetical protein